MLKRHVREKHSSLLSAFVNTEIKSSITIGPLVDFDQRRVNKSPDSILVNVVILNVGVNVVAPLSYIISLKIFLELNYLLCFDKLGQFR